jgi:hypothetical protein
MFYELWDLESKNMIDDFDTEAEALIFVHGLLEANLASYADFLALGCTDDTGSHQLVAQGRPLAVMADRFVKEQPESARPSSARRRTRRRS